MPFYKVINPHGPRAWIVRPIKDNSSNKEPGDASKIVKIQVCKIYLESKTGDNKVTQCLFVQEKQ